MDVTGLRFPILCRPFGSHAGEDLSKIEDPAQLAECLAERRMGGGYLTEFIDLTGADGLYRKARLYWIGGGVYPEHYYVSDQWNVHEKGSLRLMAKVPRLRDEAAAFLRSFDPAGPMASVLAKLAARLKLDVFMVDVGFDRNGGPVLFEANATITAILPDQIAVVGDHLAPFVARLRDAFNCYIETCLKRESRPAFGQ